MSTPPTPRDSGRGAGGRRRLSAWKNPDGTPVPPEQVKAISRATITIAMLVVITLIVATSPLPWRLAAIAMIAWTVVAIVQLWRSTAPNLRRAITPVVTISGFLTVITAINMGWVVLTWDQQWQLQECTTNALTVQASDICQKQYIDSVTSWTDRILGTSTSQP